MKRTMAGALLAVGVLAGAVVARADGRVRCPNQIHCDMHDEVAEYEGTSEEGAKGHVYWHYSHPQYGSVYPDNKHHLSLHCDCDRDR